MLGEIGMTMIRCTVRYSWSLRNDAVANIGEQALLRLSSGRG